MGISSRIHGIGLSLAWAVLLLVGITCAGTLSGGADPQHYRLSGSSDWQVVGSDRVLDDLSERYPEFFALVLDPDRREDIDLRAIRDDLEHQPADRRNYDALNATAIAYFVMNERAEEERGGELYFVHSFRAAKLVAVPWQAYGRVADPELRDSILDFFEDIASGSKHYSARTASRLHRVVSSLARKEDDAARLERIRALSERLAPPEPGR
ncbi:MAG: hypothetical protein ACE5IL_01700 [Myxococcota bacterium]